MATEGTAKVRRLIHKLNSGHFGTVTAKLLADPLKTLCQEIEAQDNRLTALESAFKLLNREVERLL